MAPNHQSFLRLIGLDEKEPTPTPSASATVSSDEWPVEEIAQAQEEAPQEIPPEEISAEVSYSTTEPDESHLSSNDEAPAPPEPDLQADPEPSQRVTRTERYESNEIPESTSVYTHAERKALNEDSSLSRLLKESTPTEEKSRATLPLGEGAEPATAHFDYDQEQGHSRLVVLDGNSEAKAYHLTQFPMRVGRDQMNEISLDDSNVSRFHAEFRERNGEIYICDLNSTNGVKVNGARAKEQAVMNHDVIQIGEVLFEFLGPGVLSKGGAQKLVFEEDPSLATASSAQGRSKRTKLIIALAASTVVAVLGILLAKNSPAWKEKLKREATEAVAKQAEGELRELKSGLEKTFAKPVQEIDTQDLRKALLQRLESSSVAKFIPKDFRDNISKLPDDLLRVMVLDPQLVTLAMQRGGNIDGLKAALQTRLGQYVSEKRLGEGLFIAEIVQQIDPNNEQIKETITKLKGLLGQDDAATPTTGAEISVDDKKKFYQYMNQHEETFNKLVAARRFGDALQFANLVKDNLSEAKRIEPRLSLMVDDEFSAWDERLKGLKSRASEVRKEAEMASAEDEEVDELIDSIRMHVDFAEVREAFQEINEFMRKYPKHPKMREILRLKRETERHIEESFMATQEKVLKLVEAESYASAWEELYRFLDLMADSEEALKLRDTLTVKTRDKAVQFYNQGRVFEFETGDLVAAEQYYKKAIDTSDPRSELHRKAERLYADVRRKSVR